MIVVTGRRTAAALLAAATVLATAGCTSTVDGSLAGTPGAPASGGFPSSPSSSPSSTAPTSSTGSPSSPSSTASLVPLLEEVPAGYQPGHLAWDRNVTPTPAQFVAHFYSAADRAHEVGVVTSEGLRQVAHRLWFSAKAQDDVVLLRFATAGGAQTRFSGTVAANRADSGYTTKVLGGNGLPVVLIAKKKDSDGYVVARSYARVGTIVVETHALFSPSYDDARNTAWLRTQIARLQ